MTMVKTIMKKIDHDLNEGEEDGDVGDADISQEYLLLPPKLPLPRSQALDKKPDKCTL